MRKYVLYLIMFLLLMSVMAGCGPDERILEHAGTYFLDKDYYTVTLQLDREGEYAYEKIWTEEEHPMVREMYRGSVETESGKWMVGRDRMDREREVIVLMPSPPNITRLVITESGDLDEFISNDVYEKQ